MAGKAKEVVDRLRAKLRDDPKAAGRIVAAIRDICECGGSVKHDEHADECARYAEPHGEDCQCDDCVWPQYPEAQP